MATFALLLFLILLFGLPNDSSAEDRTYWNHELNSCEARGRAYNLLEQMSVADIKEKIAPALENPQFEKCWDYVYYKRNRTNDRFKKRVEDKVGDQFDNAIYRILKYVGKQSDHDNSIGELLGAIKRWRKCVDLRSHRTICDEEESKMIERLDEYYPDIKTENSTIHLKNLRARMRHLQQRHRLRANAVNIISTFSNAVYEASEKMRHDKFDSEEWEKKCRMEFGSAFWGHNVITTKYTLKISQNAFWLNKSFQNIEKIDQKAEEYLNVLKEFRKCEANKGKYDPECIQIRINADSIDPIHIDDSEEERSAQIEIDKSRKKSLFKSMLISFGRGGLVKLYKEYTVKIDKEISEFHSRQTSLNRREIIDDSSIGWLIENQEQFRSSLNDSKKELESINTMLEKQYEVIELFATMEKCAQEEEFSCSYLARQIAKILENN